MSLVGRKPVPIPAGVKVAVAGQKVLVEGPKGKLEVDVHPRITVGVEGATVVCKRADDNRVSRALHGLTRSLIQNNVLGVSKGFQKRLEIVGVGFNAAIENKTVLKLTVGYSQPVRLPIPSNLTVTVPDPTHVLVTGIDKQAVGQFAATVRASRKTEPYKGTGIKYDGEVVRRKAGKTAGAK